METGVVFAVDERLDREARARVQAPTIYRLFGDKDGLLEAVAEHVLMDFVSRKATRVLSDPLGG